MTQTILTFLQQQALILMQSMLGVISSNFRMVSITTQDDLIVVQVVLEHASEEDQEELEDCQSEFEALQSTKVKFEFNVIANEGDIDWPDNSIIIYRRRES